MKDMTDEEYAALDKKWTDNPPDVAENGTGFFAKRQAAKALNARMITLDGFTADYLLTKAIQTHETPAEVVAEMVRHEMAYA
jgi:hypothetical protein